MNESSRTLAEMLDADLARVGLSQKELPALLAQEGEEPISEQSISNWKNRGRIPTRRMDQLIEILGPESEIAVAHAKGLISYRAAKPDLRRKTLSTPRLEGNAAFVSPASSFLLQGRQTEEQIRNALPVDLQCHFQSVIAQGGFSYRIDYFSPRVAAELRFVPTETDSSRLPNLAESIFRRAVDNIVPLLAANALRPSSNRVLGLVFVCEGEIPPRAMNALNKTVFTAALLNVRVAVVHAAEDAAHLIEEWENGNDPLGPTSYDEE